MAKRRRKFEVGTRIITTTIALDTAAGVGLYWFEQPSPNAKKPVQLTLYGPFATDAEVGEHQRVTLLGPQAKIEEGGQWDPAWDKTQ